MQKVIGSERIPIKLWTDEVEDGAMEQIKHLANLPFVFKHLAIMPDVHEGYGMPIGGVLATEGVVIPNAVGVDIGCGMCAVRTNVRSITTDIVKAIMGRIRKLVPVGFEHQKESQEEALMPVTNGKIKSGEEWFVKYLPVCADQYKSALRQLGTLGGGNHFIELQKGSDGFVWIMIHSGSRNLGKQVADVYNKTAINLNAKWHTQVPKEWELAFLPMASDIGQTYMWEMQYCVDFALANRRLMMDRCKMAFVDAFGEEGSSIEFDEMINIAHNYARLENHFGKNVLVHRKGATSARDGEIGIIPGSMGTRSFIVRGKGSAEAFDSCSHGSGRKLGRKEACRTLNLDEQKALMDAQGIVHGLRTTDDLEEAPGAYKDIEAVMQNQTDLAEILVELKPLGVVKG